MRIGHGQKSVRQQLDEGAVLKALEIGSKSAVRAHMLLGNPVATVRDGKVVLVSPEEIRIDEATTVGKK